MLSPARDHLAMTNHAETRQALARSASLFIAAARRPTWEQAEGSALPLGATWIEAEQAFNFAVHAELAESVALLLYTPEDLVNPSLAYRFDFLRNKSGRIWHCRIPLSEIGDSRYYSVSGEGVTYNHSFDPQKIP